VVRGKMALKTYQAIEIVVVRLVIKIRIQNATGTYLKNKKHKKIKSLLTRKKMIVKNSYRYCN
jgi:hypothetical protein